MPLFDKEASIIDLMEKDEYCAQVFKPKKKDDEAIDSWANWKVFLKGVYGIPFGVGEKQQFKKYTKLDSRPSEGFDEIYSIVGRRGGKSQIVALIAVYEALFSAWEDKVNPGVTGYVFIISTDKSQSRVILDYCKGLIENSPALENMIVKSTEHRICLANGSEIKTQAGNYRGLRGYTAVAVILDELAFFRSEPESANPASEIITAAWPMLDTTEGRIIGISTPYGKFGYLWDTYKDYEKRIRDNLDIDYLLWHAPTLDMNPTLNKERIEKRMRRDPVKMRAEYLALFREDVETYLPESIIDALIDLGTPMRSSEPEIYYRAFCDVSGAKNDSMTYAIAHEEGKKVVLDFIYEITAPFDFNEQFEKCADMLHEYRILEIVGDAWGGDFPTQKFRDLGIKYTLSEKNKSELYLDFAFIAQTARVRLLESERLKTQILNLDRKKRSGGKDLVEHRPGAHDDIINSVAGVSSLIFSGIRLMATKEDLEKRMPTSHRRLIKKKSKDEKDMFDTEMRVCPRCHGSGNEKQYRSASQVVEEIIGEAECPRCKGDGKVKKYQQYIIKQ